MKINPFMSICPPLGFIFSPYILTLTHRVIDMCVLSKAPLIVVNMAIEQWQLMPQRNQSQTCSPPLPATRCGVHHIFCWFKKWVWSSLLFPSFTCNVCISPPPHTQYWLTLFEKQNVLPVKIPLQSDPDCTVNEAISISVIPLTFFSRNMMSLWSIWTDLFSFGIAKIIRCRSFYRQHLTCHTVGQECM